MVANLTVLLDKQEAVSSPTVIEHNQPVSNGSCFRKVSIERS